jgi:hypothetical protein
MVVCGVAWVVPWERGVGCDCEARLDLHVEVAVQNRHRSNSHFLAENDGAGALVDDHAGWPVSFHFQLLKIGKKLGRARGECGRDGYAHQARVFRMCRGRIQIVIDGGYDPLGGSEIRGA